MCFFSHFFSPCCTPSLRHRCTQKKYGKTMKQIDELWWKKKLQNECKPTARKTSKSWKKLFPQKISLFFPSRKQKYYCMYIFWRTFPRWTQCRNFGQRNNAINCFNEKKCHKKNESYRLCFCKKDQSNEMHMIRIRCLKYLFDLLVLQKNIMFTYISEKSNLKLFMGFLLDDSEAVRKQSNFVARYCD